MEASGELSKFKEHVQLYEFLMERAEKRTIAGIMPAIKSLQKEVDATNQIISNAANEIKSSSTKSSMSSDPVFIIGLLVWLAAFGFACYKYAKQQRLI